jgi:hypothetical protein
VGIVGWPFVATGAVDVLESCGTSAWAASSVCGGGSFGAATGCGGSAELGAGAAGGGAAWATGGWPWNWGDRTGPIGSVRSGAA